MNNFKLSQKRKIYTYKRESHQHEGTDYKLKSKQIGESELPNQ